MVWAQGHELSLSHRQFKEAEMFLYETATDPLNPKVCITFIPNGTCSLHCRYYHTHITSSLLPLHTTFLLHHMHTTLLIATPTPPSSLPHPPPYYHTHTTPHYHTLTTTPTTPSLSRPPPSSLPRPPPSSLPRPPPPHYHTHTTLLNTTPSLPRPPPSSLPRPPPSSLPHPHYNTLTTLLTTTPTPPSSLLLFVAQVSFVSTLVNQSVVQPFLFCNYRHRPGNPAAHCYPSTTDARVWEAIMASTAAPGYLEEVKIGPHVYQVTR